MYGEETTYFTNWVEEIDKAPESFWSVFWLSQYDQKREEEALKEEEKKQKEEKENETETEGKDKK